MCHRTPPIPGMPSSQAALAKNCLKSRLLHPPAYLTMGLKVSTSTSQTRMPTLCHKVRSCLRLSQRPQAPSLLRFCRESLSSSAANLLYESSHMKVLVPQTCESAQHKSDGQPFCVPRWDRLGNRSTLNIAKGGRRRNAQSDSTTAQLECVCQRKAVNQSRTQAISTSFPKASAAVSNSEYI